MCDARVAPLLTLASLVSPPPQNLKSEAATLTQGDVDGEIVSVTVLRVGYVPPAMPTPVDDPMVVDVPGDTSLLMGNLKKQNEKAKASLGFTTKSMREVERMRKEKVYREASLKIVLPDRTSVNVVVKVGGGGTGGIVKSVIDEVVERTFVEGMWGQSYRMHVAPPRRNVVLSNTLKEEGLVPTGLVQFVFEGVEGGGAGWIREGVANGAAIVPAGRKIGEAKGGGMKGGEKPPPAKKEKKEVSEEDMMRKMMGKSKSLGGGGSGGGGGKGADGKAASVLKFLKK